MGAVVAIHSLVLGRHVQYLFIDDFEYGINCRVSLYLFGAR